MVRTKIVVLGLAGVLALGALAGCGGDSDGSEVGGVATRLVLDRPQTGAQILPGSTVVLAHGPPDATITSMELLVDGRVVDRDKSVVQSLRRASARFSWMATLGPHTLVVREVGGPGKTSEPAKVQVVAVLSTTTTAGPNQTTTTVGPKSTTTTTGPNGTTSTAGPNETTTTLGPPVTGLPGYTPPHTIVPGTAPPATTPVVPPATSPVTAPGSQYDVVLEDEAIYFRCTGKPSRTLLTVAGVRAGSEGSIEWASPDNTGGTAMVSQGTTLSVELSVSSLTTAQAPPQTYQLTLRVGSTRFPGPTLDVYGGCS